MTLENTLVTQQQEMLTAVQQERLTAVLTSGRPAHIIELLRSDYFQSIQLVLIASGQAEAVAKMQQEMLTAMLGRSGKLAHIIKLADDYYFQNTQGALIENGQADAVAAMQQQIVDAQEIQHIIESQSIRSQLSRVFLRVAGKGSSGTQKQTPKSQNRKPSPP